jgi:excinuclease ABC subunit C
MLEAVRQQIDRAPVTPGVYIFRGEERKILYVGKAIRLRDRLKAYVPPVKDERPSVAIMVPLIREVEWLLTDTEKEALLLENSLIKTHRPRYNISLRDDKSYVSLRLTKHDFPRLFVTRNIVRDGSEYFGPYSSAAGLRGTLKLIQQLFRIRDCNDSFYARRSRPCLRYEIKRCSAPCVGFVSPERYAEQVREAKSFLSGRREELSKRLAAEMERASAEMRYEDAAILRDRLAELQGTLEPQEVESRRDERDADAIGLAGDNDATLIKVLKIRKGRLISADEFMTEEPVVSRHEILRAFLQEYYLADFPGHEVPAQLLLPAAVEDGGLFASLLRERSGRKVAFLAPQRGNARKILRLAERNAASAFGERKRKTEKTQRTLTDVAMKLGLEKPPARIEGFDISNFQGAEPVGSMVVFIGGEPDKTKYRHYGIRSVKGANDFAMLKEMFGRRFRKMTDADRPDLIVIDGGRGQLRQAVDALRESGGGEVPLVSIAKERELRSKSGRKLAPERLFRPGQKNPLLFPGSSPVLQLFQRVRDEAHRFGISRHRRARSRATIRSELSRIPGIGPKRQRILLRTFGSLDGISRASVEEMAQVSGIPRGAAERVREFFDRRKGSSEE